MAVEACNFQQLHTATMKFHVMNSTPADRKVKRQTVQYTRGDPLLLGFKRYLVQESCHLLYVCQGVLTGGSTRKLLALLEVNAESLKEDISLFRILPHVQLVYCGAC